MQREGISSVAGHGHNCHILDNQCIGSGLLYGNHVLPCFLQFIIVEDCVQGYKNPCPESMCIFTELPDILHFISGSLSGSEPRPGYIHSIGTAVDCCDADMSVSCRSKQFKLIHIS